MSIGGRPIGRRTFFLSLAAAGAARAHTVRDRDRLLDEVVRRACRYFIHEVHPRTGLVRDRARMNGRDGRRISSIAATGFGLSALAIADRNDYIERGAARRRAEAALEFFARSAPQERGFFYHFLDIETGERAWGSEVSSVDTAWLLCGALHCRSHFDTPGITRLADELLDRVEWPWMLDGALTLRHGWTPERGFLSCRWDKYSELLAMVLLALGSKTNPVPPAAWDAWARPRRKYAGLDFIDSRAPLFVHQYSHAWFDFRSRRDRHADYFENSRCATAAHRLHCMSLAGRYPWYGPALWGVTASDSRHGYMAWSEPDGTVVPCAAGGSIAFLPVECAVVLRTTLDRYGARAWGKYGFVDAFHPEQGWFSPDVIGIDLGIMLLMIENLRSESVWQAVMATPEAQRGMRAAGLSQRAAT